MPELRPLVFKGSLLLVNAGGGHRAVFTGTNGCQYEQELPEEGQTHDAGLNGEERRDYGRTEPWQRQLGPLWEDAGALQQHFTDVQTQGHQGDSR